VGSSHNRPTSAEDNEEALLLGCPPIGPFFGDEQVYDRSEEKAKRKPYIPGLKRRGFAAKSGKDRQSLKKPSTVFSLR
jgi:hypothetical protein